MLFDGFNFKGNVFNILNLIFYLSLSHGIALRDFKVIEKIT